MAIRKRSIHMKKRVLFVDDEEINLFVLSRRFEEDFEVLTANSAEEAMQLIQDNQGKLHALISDLKMPDITGLQMIEKARDILKDVPCFLLTGYDYNEEIEKALNDKVITKLFKKPFNYNEINDTLKEYLY